MCGQFPSDFQNCWKTKTSKTKTPKSKTRGCATLKLYFLGLLNKGTLSEIFVNERSKFGMSRKHAILEILIERKFWSRNGQNLAIFV